MRESRTGDVELVLAARAGDISALGLLLQRHRARLYAAAVARLRDREAAADAVQEAFLVAMTRLHTPIDDGSRRDQTRLEKSRLDEWKAFYQLLHQTPEPRTYRGLYHPDVMVRDDAARWRGIHAWSAEEREAINLGVCATITVLVAGPALTVLEIDFQNPPSAPGHCPPSTTFVHHLHQGQTARLDIAYHVS